MLSSSFSSLPNELLSKIVTELGNDINDLDALSLTDRVFTPLCQRALFKRLKLSGKRSDVRAKLKELQSLNQENPVLITYFRALYLNIGQGSDMTWILDDPIFMSVMQALGNSSTPPSTLKIDCDFSPSTLFDDPLQAIGRLAQSFLPSSLTKLTIASCDNIPPSLFLAFPKLKVIKLDSSKLGEDVQDAGSHYLGSEPPCIERFTFRSSRSITRRLVKPLPPQKAIVDWSGLKSLRLPGQEEGSVRLVQPLLDSAQGSLESIDFTYPCSDYLFFSTSDLVTFQALSNLSALSFDLYIEDPDEDPQSKDVVSDFTTLLKTLPKSNKLQNLSIRIDVQGTDPYTVAHSQPWEALASTLAEIPSGLNQGLHLNLRCGIREDILKQDPGRLEAVQNLLKEKMSILWSAPPITLRFSTYTKNLGYGKYE